MNTSSCTGVDSGEMDVQMKGEEEEEEDRMKEQQRAKEEERAERSTESTIHTIPELLLDTMQVHTGTHTIHSHHYHYHHCNCVFL